MSLAFGDRVVYTDPHSAPGSPSMPMSGEVIQAEDGQYLVRYDGYRHLSWDAPAARIPFSEADVETGALVLEHEYLARPFARQPWNGDR